MPWPPEPTIPSPRAVSPSSAWASWAIPWRATLADSGHHVTVYNRTAAKSQAWVQAHGGASAATPALAAQGAELGVRLRRQRRRPPRRHDGRRRRLRGRCRKAPSSSTTRPRPPASPASSRSRRRALGFAFVDAPVSGGNLGAINGALTVMCGGDQAAFEHGTSGGDGVRQGDDPARPERLGPAGQDGQPDRDRRHRPGPLGGGSPSARKPAST